MPIQYISVFTNIISAAKPSCKLTRFYGFSRQMDRLQVEIDEENETRTELYEERSKAKDRKKKAVVESLLVSFFFF